MSIQGQVTSSKYGQNAKATIVSYESEHRAAPWLPVLLLLLPIAYFWFRLINNLRLEWSTNPQYGYGWVVPLLCLGLLLRRVFPSGAPMVRGPWSHSLSPQPSVVRGLVVFSHLALLYLPTRLVEAATPEWRPIQWVLGIQAIGLTLCAVYLVAGVDWLKRVAFPVCFFFVAIPWPTIIEIPVIQTLARLNASIVVEILGVIGIPAIQHGNVLEVGTGTVGIDDACSGIRSLQSSIMISLFLGEFYRLRAVRRILLVPLAFILAIVFNVCRTSLLTFIAAKKGVDAISQYHDEAGVTILLACTATTWLVALLLRPRSVPHVPVVSGFGVSSPAVSSPWSMVCGRWSVLTGLCLITWLLATETGVYLWYQVRESHIRPGPAWSVVFPESSPTFKDLPITAKTRYLLRFDEGKQGQWQNDDGSLCSAFYFSWAPGRVAGYLAKRHTPDICMPAAGQTLRAAPELMILKTHGVELPMRSYVFDTPGGPLYVYQCRWEAGEGAETYVAQESARFNLIRGIWAGRGIHGQKVLEIILSGYTDAESAKQSLLRQLDSLVKTQSSVAKS
jgi:exosortase